MRQSLACLLLLIIAGACAKAPFTTAVIARYQLKPSDLQRVQFYTSETIVLRRESTLSKRSTSDAALSLQDDVHIEEIEVSERTPCVALRAEGDYILLGFSRKDPRASLWFHAPEVADNTDVQPGGGRMFELVALDNTVDEPGPFTPRWSSGYLVSWAGNKYYVVSGRSAYLLYQNDDDLQRHKVEHQPPGWRVSEGVLNPRVR